MQHLSTIAALIYLALPAPAWALSITVGDYLLEPNLAGQRIAVKVAGGEEVPGLNLFAQVGDGGPELATLPNPLPPGTDGPAITGVDVLNGTIFAGVPDQPTDLGSIPQVAIWSLALTGPVETVPADGTLVRLTIDTTGFQTGSWDLLLADVLPDLGPFDTNFAGIEADQIDNGTITLGTLLGDLDLNGRVDFDDIAPFATGLSSPVSYTSEFGIPPRLRGDTNGDLQLDFDDIPGFVQLLGSPGSATARAVPEPPPAGLLLLGAGLAAESGRRSRRRRGPRARRLMRRQRNSAGRASRPVA